MKKCILFSRVSTINQDLTQQTDEIKREAFNLGYDEKGNEITDFKMLGRYKRKMQYNMQYNKWYNIIMQYNKRRRTKCSSPKLII